MNVAFRCALHRFLGRDIEGWKTLICIFTVGAADALHWLICYVSLRNDSWQRIKPAKKPAHLLLSLLQSRVSLHIQETWLKRANDPSAGSPTETLLRLLLPLSDKVHQIFYVYHQKLTTATVQIIHRITQSVGATGGVYKGQGRDQHELMTRTY